MRYAKEGTSFSLNYPDFIFVNSVKRKDEYSVDANVMKPG